MPSYESPRLDTKIEVVTTTEQSIPDYKEEVQEVKVEEKKPEPPVIEKKEEKVEEKEDYTTKAELEQLLEAEPVKKDFIVYGTEFYAVSATEWFNNFLGDDAPHCLTVYF